ncbi:lysophospholipid acyltransferase family protein [Nemorincola caseinilytica]|uniref:Lysophospholipid acyltransferase family protein n=1 Tax=Nemorincola caseinilytica TaxID=2054315 RepID=A0ABP8N8H1_9BACT
MLKKILQPFYAVYVVVTFLIGLCITFPFFVLLSIGNRKATRRLIYVIIRHWARIWLWVIGMPLRITGPCPPQRRYVIVCNHISYLDTVVLFPGLPGYFRALGKKEFSKVPVMGFLYRQIVIMVNRSNPQSRARSMRLMWRVLRHESHIVIFPEGTFNETGKPLKDFYDGAFRLAITSRTPILPIIFPDTVHRWHYSAWWKVWPGRNRAVYMQPIQVDGMTLPDVPRLKQIVYDAMEQELSRYDYP